MGTLLEVGRHALEGLEVLAAFCTVAALGAGMLWGHHVTDADDEPARQQRGWTEQIGSQGEHGGHRGGVAAPSASSA